MISVQIAILYLKKGHAIVVDPGFDSDKVIKDYLKTNNLTVDVIYATHGHFDHIGGINTLKGLYPNALVVAPLKDRVFFDHTQRHIQIAIYRAC